MVTKYTDDDDDCGVVYRKDLRLLESSAAHANTTGDCWPVAVARQVVHAVIHSNERERILLWHFFDVAPFTTVLFTHWHRFFVAVY